MHYLQALFGIGYRVANPKIRLTEPNTLYLARKSKKWSRILSIQHQKVLDAIGYSVAETKK